MDKIKVTKDVANAIDHLLYREGAVYTKESLLGVHARMKSNDGQWNDEVSVLNGISVYKLAELLIQGYEVELTPEEKVIELYKESLKKSKDLCEQSEYRDYWKVHSEGMKLVMDILGVNDSL